MKTVGRTFRWLVSAGWCALWLPALQAGCSSSSDGSAAACQAACGDLCTALAACDDAPAPGDCEAQCNLGKSSLDCSDSPPADRLTCKELSASYACADYCATLCTRAPSCGTFDASACARGCAAQYHSVCNSKSVAARTCDQLKPELRLYDEAGNAGDHEIVIGGGSGDQYGLCKDAASCELPLGCSMATNTCAPCEADADCERSYPHFACSAAHECTKVACVVDADCPAAFDASSFCETTRHVCGECHTDSDCKSAIVGRVCDKAALKCVECVDNGDCPKEAPRCDASQYCGACKSDKDCTAQPGTPFCVFDCVQCRTDADCTDAAHPTCNYDGTCE